MTPNDLVLTRNGIRFQQTHFPCRIGRGGVVTNKREGDGATPVGIHHIVQMFYRPDRMACPSSWATPIRPRDLWSDDQNHWAYNQQVKAPYAHSHEVLHRSDPLYDIILVTDWNLTNPVPGKGSAIFLHQRRGPGTPTEGCVAFRRDHLKHIAARIRPNTRLIIPAALAL